MSEITRYDPLRGAEDLRRRVDALFGLDSEGMEMNIDVSESKEKVLVKADPPGVQREDISLRLVPGGLEIAANRQSHAEESGNGYYRQERSFGSIRRTVPMPDIDSSKTKADLEDGVLTISLRKADRDGSEIAISPGPSSGSSSQKGGGEKEHE